MRAPNIKIVKLKAGSSRIKNVPGTSVLKSRFDHFKDEWQNKISPDFNGKRLPREKRGKWPHKCTTCDRTFSESSTACTICGCGAHVFVDGHGDQVFLVPRCHTCNMADGVKGRKLKGKWVTLVEDSFAVSIDECNYQCDI